MFVEEPATGNYSEEPLSAGHTSTLPGRSNMEQSGTRVGNSSTLLSPGDGELDSAGDSTRNPVSTSFDDRVVGIVAGSLAAVALLFAGVVIFCIVCRRRRYADDKKASNSKVPVARPIYSAAIPGRLGNDIIVTSSGRKMSNGGQSYSDTTAFGSAITSLLQQQLPSIDPIYDDDDVIKVAPLTVACENGVGVYDVYNQTNDIMGLQPRRPLPDVPRIPADLTGWFPINFCLVEYRRQWQLSLGLLTAAAI